MTEGRIIRAVSGFYYVDVEKQGVFECRARGLFRKEGEKPLVGDLVRIEETFDSKKERTGNVIEVLPRRNVLSRPPVANIDQVLIVFSGSRPKPNLNLLDRYLVMTEMRGIPSAICLNKKDASREDLLDGIRRIYEKAGYPVLLTSACEEDGFGCLPEILAGKVTAFAGPSGVGKSSLINRLQNKVVMETGELMKKSGTGRQTTRHCQLIRIDASTYITDTPGFGSLDLPELSCETLADYYLEIARYADGCRFAGCAHICEPDCAVRKALSQGKIAQERYESYCLFYRELKEQKPKFR